MRKLYLICAPVLFLGSILVTLLHETGYLPDSIQTLYIFLWTFFFGLVLLCIFLKGTLKTSLLSLFVYFSAAMIVLGYVYKIQHWPYGNTLILGGCVSVTLSYFVHFLLKSKKRLMDWIKLIYIGLVTARTASAFMNMPEEKILSWTSVISGIILAGLFYWDEWKHKSENNQKKIRIADSGEDLFAYDDNIRQ